MEDILEVYARPYDPKRPVVCLDEKPYQLLCDPIEPLPTKPGNVAKIDNQYIREGSCSIFMLTEPLAGWRHAEALERRTMQDWALVVKWLVDEQYPSVDKIVLVEDNLNTHVIASLYATFPPETALRIAKNSKCITHQNTEAGSILLRLNSLLCKSNVSVFAAYRLLRNSIKNLQFGTLFEIQIRKALTGNLPLMTQELS